MYDLYTMKRTQIYLDAPQLVRLKSEARASRRTVSDIIREAIDDRLAQPRQDLELAQALEVAAGLWASRPDLGDTDQYLRGLRRDRRGTPRR